MSCAIPTNSCTCTIKRHDREPEWYLTVNPRYVPTVSSFTATVARASRLPGASVLSILWCNKTEYHTRKKYVTAARGGRLGVLKRSHVGTGRFKEKLATKRATTVLQGSMLILSLPQQLPSTDRNLPRTLNLISGDYTAKNRVDQRVALLSPVNSTFA